MKQYIVLHSIAYKTNLHMRDKEEPKGI